jgi:hypothetical protein
MGRPPIGKVAMTSTERVHRFRAKHRTKKPSDAKDQKIAELKARIRELEGERRGQGEGQLTRSRRGEFGEVGKLWAENAKLKSDIFKLKAMLQEEPDAAKLRKKIVDQQVEMASMRRAMKEIAKECDQYKVRVKAYQQTKYKEARRALTRQNGNLIAKVLHSDRQQMVTPAERAEAERAFLQAKPLFNEG